MIKKILYFEWISRKAQCSNFTKSTIKVASTYMFIPLLTFICFLNTCREVNSNTYLATITSITFSIVFLLQAILRINLNNIRKDPILAFIKKERYIFIKRKVELKICKAICMFIIPMELPFLIYSKDKMVILCASLISLISFYLINMIFAYLVIYLEAVTNRSIFYKFVYILGIIIFLLLLFVLQIYMSGEIINGLLGKGKNTLLIHWGRNITILTVISVLGMGGYLMTEKVVKDNLYVILNPYGGSINAKSSLLNKMLKSKIENLYIKILVKDLCSFIRKKGMEFYSVVLFQVGIFIIYCFTILQDRVKVLSEKIYLVSGFYFICCFISIFMLIAIIFANIKEINVNTEFEVIRKFNVKANKLKILIGKSNFTFLLLSAPIIATGLTNFLLDISLSGAAQTMLILATILSWLKYSSLFATDIVNYKLNELRCMFFLGISAVSAKIIIGIFSSSGSKNVNELIIKYLIAIFINILGYYIEMVLIKLIERNGISD